jgi:DNA topoisomerase-1
VRGFRYVTPGGQRHSIDSADVNDYLREVSGEDFTAKDFRTWAGTVLAVQSLQELAAFESETQARRNLTQAIKAVAGRLGNTVAVCRKCYVHPVVVDAYLTGSLRDLLQRRAEEETVARLPELPPEEAAVLLLLMRRTSGGPASSCSNAPHRPEDSSRSRGASGA